MRFIIAILLIGISGDLVADDIAYRLYSGNGDYAVSFEPPSDFRPRGLAVCRDQYSGNALWSIEDYSSRAAVSDDGRCMAIWSGSVTSQERSALSVVGVTVYYDGIKKKSWSISDLMGNAKGGAKLNHRADGQWDWILRVDGFQGDDATFSLLLANAVECKFNVREGTLKSGKCKDPTLTSDYERARGKLHLGDAVTAISSKMFERSLKSDGSSNSIASPYLLAHTLLRLGELADKSARDEVQQALGVPSLLVGRMLPAESIIGGRSPNMLLSTALWYRSDLQLKADFAARCSEAYNLAKPMPKVEDQLIKDATEWLQMRTRSKEAKFTPDDLVPNTLFVLLTTGQFASRWKYPFSETATLQFVSHKNEKKRVSAVRGTIPLRVKERTDKSTVASLRLEDERYSLVVILPPVGVGDVGSLQSLVVDSGALRGVLAEVDLENSKMYDARVPTLKFSSTLDLASFGDTLKIGSLLKPDSDTFAGAFSGDIGRVDGFRSIQRSAFQLDEHGISATAVQTSSAGTLGGVATPSFVVNRPFVFLVYDRVIECPLFQGVVNDLDAVIPSSKK